MQQDLRRACVEQRHADRKRTHPVVMRRIEQIVSSGKEYERIDEQQYDVFGSRWITTDESSSEMGHQEDQKHSELKHEHGRAFLMVVVFVVPDPEE